MAFKGFEFLDLSDIPDGDCSQILSYLESSDILDSLDETSMPDEDRESEEAVTQVSKDSFCSEEDYPLKTDILPDAYYADGNFIRDDTHIDEPNDVEPLPEECVPETPVTSEEVYEIESTPIQYISSPDYVMQPPHAPPVNPPPGSNQGATFYIPPHAQHHPTSTYSNPHTVYPYPTPQPQVMQPTFYAENCQITVSPYSGQPPAASNMYLNPTAPQPPAAQQHGHMYPSYMVSDPTILSHHVKQTNEKPNYIHAKRHDSSRGAYRGRGSSRRRRDDHERSNSIGSDHSSYGEAGNKTHYKDNSATSHYPTVYAAPYQYMSYSMNAITRGQSVPYIPQQPQFISNSYMSPHPQCFTYSNAAQGVPPVDPVMTQSNIHDMHPPTEDLLLQDQSVTTQSALVVAATCVMTTQSSTRTFADSVSESICSTASASTEVCHHSEEVSSAIANLNISSGVEVKDGNVVDTYENAFCSTQTNFDAISGISLSPVDNPVVDAQPEYPSQVAFAEQDEETIALEPVPSRENSVSPTLPHIHNKIKSTSSEIFEVKNTTSDFDINNLDSSKRKKNGEIKGLNPNVENFVPAAANKTLTENKQSEKVKDWFPSVIADAGAVEITNYSQAGAIDLTFSEPYEPVENGNDAIMFGNITVPKEIIAVETSQKSVRPKTTPKNNATSHPVATEPSRKKSLSLVNKTNDSPKFVATPSPVVSDKAKLESLSNSNSQAETAWGQKKSWSQLFKSSDDKQNKQIAYVTPFKESSEDTTILQHDTSSSSGIQIKNPALEDLEKTKVGGLLTKYNQDFRPISLQPRGLINKNYWCYVNAPLQALLFCPSFYQLLQTLSKECGSHSGNTVTPFINGFVDFIKEFPTLPKLSKSNRKDRNSNSSREPEVVTGSPFEPYFIYKMLTNNKENQFIEGRQQDAEEMLSCVLNGLHDEMVEALKLAGGKTSPKVNGVSEEAKQDQVFEDDSGDEWKVQGPKRRSCITRTAHFNQSPISEIFWGQLRSVLQQTGGNTTANLQPFNTLPLDIQSPKVDTLKEALCQLVTREEISGMTCPKTNQEVTATTQVMLEDLPRVLILQLKRFIYDKDGGLQKVTKRLQFPIDLEITKDLLSVNSRGKFSPSQRKYKLFAIVNHEGKEATKGHYVSDIYHPGHGLWLRCDDSSVKPVSEAVVLKHDPPRVPYLLFYKRSDGGTSFSSSSSSTSSSSSHSNGSKYKS